MVQSSKRSAAMKCPKCQSNNPEQIRNSGMMGAMFKGLQRGPISAQWPEWIDVSLEEYGQDPSGQIRRLYRRYRECAQGTF